MQIDRNPLPCCNATICGEDFKPADDTSCYAVFRLPSCTCGAVVEVESGAPWLHVFPSIQIPPAARRGFARFQLEHPNGSLADLVMDDCDGEIAVRRSLPGVDPADIKEPLSKELSWIDAEVYPAVKAYVREALRSS